MTAKYQCGNKADNEQESFVTFSYHPDENDVYGLFRLGVATYELLPCDASFADCHLWANLTDQAREPVVRESGEARRRLWEEQKAAGVSQIELHLIFIALFM